MRSFFYIEHLNTITRRISVHTLYIHIYEVIKDTPVFVKTFGLADIHPQEDCTILVKDFLIHEKIIGKGEKINIVCVKKDRLI